MGDALGAWVGVGRCSGQIPGRAPGRDPAESLSWAVQPAPALIGARGWPAAGSPATPSQSRPPELRLPARVGVGGVDAASLRAELPSQRSSLPAGGAPELRPSLWLQFPRPLASRSVRWDAPRRRPELPSLVVPTAARRPPCPFQSHEGGGPGPGSASETGCSRPSPTLCRHRRPWSRLTRTRWTSAPKCSSMGFCGSGRSGDRRPSGPGGE